MKRLEWVDSLRGVAALLVVILHLWLYLINNFSVEVSGFAKEVSYVLFGYLDFGKIGVVAFFLISGYVIPYSFRGKTNKEFFFNRFFRLYPAYWVSILFCVIIIGMPPVRDLICNITMFQRFLGINDLVAVFWTLQIEIIFYFICAALHYYKLLENDKFIVKTVIAFLLLSLLIAFARYELDKKLPVALFLALTVMFFGLCWRRFTIDKSVDIKKTTIIRLLILIVLVLLPITMLAYSKDYGFNETWYRYFLSYTVALIMFFLFSHYKFVNKILLFLGNISYSLYLLHALFGIELTNIIMNAIHIKNIFAYIITFFVLSFVSATLCYYYVEKPSVKLGKRIATHWKNKKSKVL